MLHSVNVCVKVRNFLLMLLVCDIVDINGSNVWSEEIKG